MTFVNIDDYANSMTVAEIKELKSNELKLKESEDRMFIKFLQSYEGKYVVCQFNVDNGLVCQLQKDWWTKEQPVISISKSNIYKEVRPINYLWLKSTNKNSVNEMREISKEEYELVLELLNSVENIRYRLQQTLFVKK
jgi:hypothetical protein